MSRVENMFVTGETPPASAQTSFKAKVTPAQTVTFPAATEAAAEAAADLRATVKDAFATARLKITADVEPGASGFHAGWALDKVPMLGGDPTGQEVTARPVQVRYDESRWPAELTYRYRPDAGEPYQHQTYVREDLAWPQPAPLDTFRLEPAMAAVIREAVEAVYEKATADWADAHDERLAADERESAAAARADRLARALDILPKTKTEG